MAFICWGVRVWRSEDNFQEPSLSGKAWWQVPFPADPSSTANILITVYFSFSRVLFFSLHCFAFVESTYNNYQNSHVKCDVVWTLTVSWLLGACFLHAWFELCLISLLRCRDMWGLSRTLKERKQVLWSGKEKLAMTDLLLCARSWSKQITYVC